MNVTNSNGGTGTGNAANFSSAARSGFGVNIARTTNGATWSGTAASLSVTRGANIDSLYVPGRFVMANGTGYADFTGSTVDFTNATVIGLNNGNLYSQTSTAGVVQATQATNSGLEVQMSGTNTNPAIIANAAAGAATSGDLLQLRKGGTAVMRVGNSGATTIVDAVSTTGFALDVANTAAGTSTAGAAQFSGSNRTGFGTNITRSNNGATFSATNASLGVTRGAVIDTLNISNKLQFTNGSVADFTGVTVTGLLANHNQFLQNATNATVTTGASTAAGVEVQMSGTNSDPAIVANAAAGAATSGDLLQLQKAGAPVFQVGNTGDVTVNTNKFKVTAADGSVNVGPGNFVITGASGATTIVDAVSTAGYTVNVSNTAAGLSTAGAASLTASNRTGFGTNISRTGNGATFSVTNASLGVTRGAVIDTLQISSKLQFTNGAVADFTGVTVTGLLANHNQFLQNATGAVVTTGSTVASGVEISMSGTNTDPALVVNSAAGAPTSGDLLQLKKGNISVVAVANAGNTTVTVGSGTALKATTTSTVAGDGAIHGIASAPGTSGVIAEGGGVSAPGVLNATALEVRNGVVRYTGAVKGLGTFTITIPAGKRFVTATVPHPLVEPTSVISLSVVSSSGLAINGMDHDTFTARIRSRGAGTFNVDISCDQGDEPMDADVTVEYSIINQ